MFPSFPYGKHWVSFCFQDANYAYATWQGILTKIRACEHVQKFCENEQASTHLIFASNSSKGQILRALSNWMGPFDTPSGQRPIARTVFDNYNSSIAAFGGTFGSPSALEEHRRIFGYRPPVGAVRRPLQGSGATKGRGRPYFLPKNTFTKSVCLLGEHWSGFSTDSVRENSPDYGRLGRSQDCFQRRRKCSTRTWENLGDVPCSQWCRRIRHIKNERREHQTVNRNPLSIKGVHGAVPQECLRTSKKILTLRPIQKNLGLEVQATVRS